MYVIVLVYLIVLSLDNIGSTPFNQTTEERTKDVLIDTQTESTGMELTDKVKKHQTTLTQ